MKRSQPLRADPDKVRAFNERGRDKLSPGRSKKDELSPQARRMRATWWRETRKMPCAVCGRMARDGPGVIEAHHVVALNLMVRAGVPDVFWWDPRNRLPLCSEPAPNRCHDRHTLHVRRVPLAVILTKAPDALDFAAEVGLDWYIGREYA